MFHLRGPAPVAGDHTGSGACSSVLGYFFEATDGDIELDQQFCIGDRRVGRRVGTRDAAAATARPSSRDNAFVYRFEGDRIAEMWMFLGALPDAAEAFFA